MAQNEQKKLPVVELLGVVVTKNKGETAVKILNALNVNLQILTYAKGTADSTIAEYFDLDSGEKDMVFALIKVKHKQKILDALSTHLSLGTADGIAFTIPIKSAMYSTLSQMGFEFD